ncbi:MAG: hypothetical protein M3P22_00350, partial [bacterium]|nr:hypothetical protein [bacterium]
AKGVVILYNAFSPTPQKLDIDTRLEGSNGKIYKTNTKITIPGMNLDKTPGKIEVGIYAVELGEEANSEPIDFKILGFKGTPKYTKFYGRSKGAIVGGLVGKFHTLSTLEKEAVVGELKASLKEKLYKKATDQIPEGYILYPNAIFFDANEDDVVTSSKELEIPVSIKGVLYGFLLEEKSLTNKIAKNVIGGYTDEDLYISNIKDLEFNILNNNELTKDIKNISFKISGTTKFIYRVDTERIVGDLLEKNKKYFNQILSAYPNIESADLVLFPPWMTTLPNKHEKLKIIVNYPKS